LNKNEENEKQNNFENIFKNNRNKQNKNHHYQLNENDIRDYAMNMPMKGKLIILKKIDYV